jgi:hypothetical protein
MYAQRKTNQRFIKESSAWLYTTVGVAITPCCAITITKVSETSLTITLNTGQAAVGIYSYTSTIVILYVCANLFSHRYSSLHSLKKDRQVPVTTASGRM